MKKITLSAILILLIHFTIEVRCYSQTNSIGSYGNVGIGLTNPTSILHLQGTGPIRPTFESISSAYSINDRSILDFKKSHGTVGNLQAVGFNDKLGTIYFQGYDGVKYIESSGFGASVEGSVSTGVVKTGMYFSTNDGTDQVRNYPKTKMYLTAEGNLMINPAVDINGNLLSNALVGDGKLQVRGIIRAKEVKVEIANWPDYVFAKEYKLPNLSETEAYIKEHQHLPGIPSAMQIEKNGLALGEMNAKLLEKIEELTLHLIELKKSTDSKIDSLSLKIHSLKKVKQK